MTARRVDLSSRDCGFGNVEASPILAILGPGWFAQFTAVKVRGKVVWCNFELARALGFEVPPSNQMTPQLHQQLIDALSYRAVRGRSRIKEAETITLFADKYGGDGLGPALGAGRSGFLLRGNLYIKGVGLTPLFRHDDPSDLAHSHGGVQMNDCLGEAVFGEVNQHLFSRGSTRILAVIDQGEHVVYPHGTVPIAIAVRSGMQLRPGHILARRAGHGRSLLDLFTRMTRETGQLVTGHDAATGRELPDLKATMLRIIDDHARTTAEQFRWRMMHGAVTSSNMGLNGSMLDLTTQTAQPRTAPVCFALEDESTFGREHIDSARELRSTYRALIASIPRPRRHPLNARLFNFAQAMEKAYDQHLQVQLLSAAGLKTEVARRMRDEHADLSRRFTQIITAMCELKNPGNLEMARRLVETVSVLDVFNLLGEFPEIYFADPAGSHKKEIRAALKPIFKGNTHHVAKKRSIVRVLIGKLDRVYREMIIAAETYATEFYGGRPRMRLSIRSRAAFENEPINLYRTILYKEFDDVIDIYKSTGNADVVREMVDRTITTSLRKTEALLGQGSCRRLSTNGLELEIQTIAGIRYSIRAWNDPNQRRSLYIRIAVHPAGNYFETQLPGWPRLWRGQIRSLRYRFTTDGWISSRVANSRLEKDAGGRFFICYEATSKLPLVGRLEGTFHLAGSRQPWPTDAGARYAGYAFAIPDKHELAQLTARMR